VVKEYGWLNERQFLDAVAVAMITPGPVVITVGFIGFLIGGFKGATVAAFATFLPCYLFTILPAPYFKKYGKRPGIVAFVDAVAPRFPLAKDQKAPRHPPARFRMGPSRNPPHSRTAPLAGK